MIHLLFLRDFSTLNRFYLFQSNFSKPAMSRPDETLPSDVDVIVLGTGLPESILAAACARVGFTVLHLDRNDYYGGPWASFNLDGITKWVQEQKNPQPIDTVSSISDIQLLDGERLIPAKSISATSDPGVHYSNVQMDWHIPKEHPKTDLDVPISDETEQSSHPEKQNIEICEANMESGNVQEKSKAENENELLTEMAAMKVEEKKTNQDWTQDRIMNEWRRFSLDLAPKILLGRGSLVELLSQSNVGRYAEFRSVNRLLTFFDGSLRVIPCSRSEVFQSTEITMIEKRMLMKFLTFCLNYDNDTERPKWQDFAIGPFTEFLSSPGQQLTDKLRHYILHALAMVSPNTRTDDALKSINEFLMSTGRYGNSPFLWTLYGSGELSQCFCRLCAVFGGVYCLRKSVEAWIFDSEGNCTGIISDGHRITCRKMVADGSYLPSELFRDRTLQKSVISRAILITDKPMTKMEGRENVSLLNYFADHLMEPVKILESGAAGCVCPNGLYVIQMTTAGSAQTTAKSDLEPVVRKFFQFGEISMGSDQCEDDRPRVLWSIFFNCATIALDGQMGENMVVTPTLDGKLTYANLVPLLKEEFTRLWPETEFLPAPPNPEETEGQEVTPNDPGINGYTPDGV